MIAWLWARTVKCPNPACGAQMPLVRSFALSQQNRARRHGSSRLSDHAQAVRFEVRTGDGARPKAQSAAGAEVPRLRNAVPLDYVRAEGRGWSNGSQMMAIVAEGRAAANLHCTSYEHKDRIAVVRRPSMAGARTCLTTHSAFESKLTASRDHRDLFTPRQFVALTTFSDLVAEARDSVINRRRLTESTQTQSPRI